MEIRKKDFSDSSPRGSAARKIYLFKLTAGAEINAWLPKSKTIKKISIH